MLSRCSLCPGTKRCIPPSIPNPVTGQPLYIGEAPGFDEDRKGEVFIGKTGRELNEHYLPLAGLRRENSNITNAIKCLPDRSGGKLKSDRKADIALLESCVSAHLYQEIQNLQPSILVPMGSFACKAIDRDIDLDLHHGMPLDTAMGLTFPMWHPAGGIHEPKKMLQIRTDWVRFRDYLRGTLRVPVDSHPNPDYAEATEADIDDIDLDIDMASDTETSRSLGPYFFTWSQQPGMGRLIRAERKDLIARLQKKLDKFKALIYFHNWLYDWNVTENMGLMLPYRQVRDTMVLAFNLGNVPQGLKALAYRLLGMTMQDFEDLVKPYSQVRVMQYYIKASECEWTRPEEELRLDEKTGHWKLYRPQSMKTKLKRFFTDFGNNPEKDIYDMWDKNWVAYHAEFEAKVGPYPGVDIAHVPFDKAAYYAMRDSDATIRLVPVLHKMRQIAESGAIQEMWAA